MERDGLADNHKGARAERVQQNLVRTCEASKEGARQQHGSEIHVTIVIWRPIFLRAEAHRDSGLLRINLLRPGCRAFRQGRQVIAGQVAPFLVSEPLNCFHLPSI